MRLAVGYRLVWLVTIVAFVANAPPRPVLANEPWPSRTAITAQQALAAAPAAVQDTPWQANTIVYDSPYLGWGHYNPQIAVDSAGNAYAVWEDCRVAGRGCDIYFAYRPAGSSWGANGRLDDDTTDTRQSAPTIAVDAAGNAYAAWQDDRAGNPDIYFAYRPAGGSWSASAKVNDDTGAATQSSPAIAVTAAGDASLVWQDDRDGNPNIYFTHRPAGGSWSANVKVNDDADVAAQTRPATAVDPSGNAYAVWTDGRNDTDYPDIYFAYRPVGGSWEANVRVNANLGSSALIAMSYPEIGAVVDGSATLHVVAAWASYEGGSWNVYSADRAADGSWGNEVRINDRAGSVKAWASAESYVDLALDATGGVYAVWADRRSGASTTDIYAAVRPVGGDRSWPANVQVNAITGKAWGSPAIAVTGSGTAHALWMDDRNDISRTYHEIYTSYLPAGGSWQINVRVNDDPGYVTQDRPKIGVDDSGNAYAIWVDDRNAGYPNVYNTDIYFAYRPAGGAWGENILINDDSPGTNAQVSPAPAVDAAGNAYAVWVDYRLDDQHGDIYFAYRPAGGSWGENTRVNDDSGSSTYHSSPALAVDAAGNVYVVWQDDRNGNLDIYFAERPAAGSWSSNMLVSDDLGGNAQYSPAIAVDPAGNAFAVWQDERAEPVSDIYFAPRLAGGSWGSNEPVNDDGTGAGQANPAIAADATGNAYVVWEDDRSGAADIYFATRSAAGVWGANERIDDDLDNSEQYSPAIAVAAGGNAFAIWDDYRDEVTYSADVYGAYRPAGGGWTANTRANDDSSATDQYSPSVALDGNGAVYAVWADERDATAHIYFSQQTVSSPNPPDPVSDLQLDHVDADIVLSWFHDGSNVDHFAVWRSSTDPFFSPDDPGVEGPFVVPAGTLSYTDPAAWAAADNFYYLVRAVNAAGSSADSPRVGRFITSIVTG